MSKFSGPSYLTIRYSVYIILIRDPCIFNLYNLCQTVSNYVCRKAHQYALHFNEKITRIRSLLLPSSVRPVPAQVILLQKGPPKLCIECHLIPPVSVPAKITWYGCQLAGKTVTGRDVVQFSFYIETNLQQTHNQNKGNFENQSKSLIPFLTKRQ